MTTKQFSPAVSSRFANLSTPRLIERVRRLEHIHERLRRNTVERRHRAIELYADADRELKRRARADDEKAVVFCTDRFAKDSAPLIEATMPEVPANLGQLTNEKLDQIADKVERLITRFTEFYPNLDGKQSQSVREVLDAHQRSVRAERARRGPPPLPVPIEVSPRLTDVDAEKKEPARKIAEKRYEPSPNVWQRRQIVRQNSKFTALRLCEVFDSLGPCLPRDWGNEFKVSSSAEAYRIPKARPRIHRIISTDRKHN